MRKELVLDLLAFIALLVIVFFAGYYFNYLQNLPQ
jgi:hypothetical protein